MHKDDQWTIHETSCVIEGRVRSVLVVCSLTDMSGLLPESV